MWKAFCGELLAPPTEGMAQALATAIREVLQSTITTIAMTTRGWGMADELDS